MNLSPSITLVESILPENGRVSKLMMGLRITISSFCWPTYWSCWQFTSTIASISYLLMANLATADLFARLTYFYLMFNKGPNTQRLTISMWLLPQGLNDTSLITSVSQLTGYCNQEAHYIFPHAAPYTDEQLAGGSDHCSHLNYGHRYRCYSQCGLELYL